MEADFGFGRNGWRGGKLLDEVAHAGLDTLEPGLVLVHAALQRRDALDLVELAEEHFAEHPGRPLAEAGRTERIDPIPNGDDHVQIVRQDLAYDPSGSLHPNLCIFCTGCGFVQLAGPVDVADVFCDYAAIHLEQLGQQGLGQPNRLSVGRRFDANIDAVLLDDDFSRGM